MVLGFEPEPASPTPRKSWHRTRYDAVRNGFTRLAAVGLFDPKDKVLYSEDREWRWNSNVVEHRYRSVDTKTEDSFDVPSWLFTSGTYLELGGAALYTVLLALQYEQGESDEPPFSKIGLSWETFDVGDEQLAKVFLSRDITPAVKRLREARVAHQEQYGI